MLNLDNETSKNVTETIRNTPVSNKSEVAAKKMKKENERKRDTIASKSEVMGIVEKCNERYSDALRRLAE